MRSAGLPPELGVLAGVGVAALLGLVVGFDRDPPPGHLLRDDRRWRWPQMIYFVFLQAPFTGGEDGLQGVPRGKLLGVCRSPACRTTSCSA